MKALVVNKPGDFGIREVSIPKPGPYEALVKITCCSICNGTDFSIINGKFPYVQEYPGILGHESAGVVVNTGDNVISFKPGDIVLRPSARYGNNDSEKLESFWGGMAEYGLIVDKAAMIADGLECSNPNAHMNQVVPASIGAYLGSVAITWKETLSSLESLGNISGKTILIWGAGPVGLAFAKWAKTLGASTIAVCARRWESLLWAKRMGADFTFNECEKHLEDELRNICGKEGFNLGIDAVGSNQIMNTILSFVSETGRAGAYGISPVDDPVGLVKDSRFTTINPDEARVHKRVMDFISWNSKPLADTIGAIVPFEYALDAFDMIRKKRALKVILDINPVEEGNPLKLR